MIILGQQKVTCSVAWFAASVIHIPHFSNYTKFFMEEPQDAFTLKVILSSDWSEVQYSF